MGVFLRVGDYSFVRSFKSKVVLIYTFSNFIARDPFFMIHSLLYNFIEALFICLFFLLSHVNQYYINYTFIYFCPFF